MNGVGKLGLWCAISVAMAMQVLGQDYAWYGLGAGVNGPVYALTVYNGELIVGGNFTEAGGVPWHYIARWDGSAWRPLGSGVNGHVYALTVYNGELIAGGAFWGAGEVECNSIARWDGSVWQPLGSGVNGHVTALTVYNGELIVGGYFTSAGGSLSNSIARWDGNGWQPLEAGTDDAVHALTVYNGELIAGGEFTTAGGVACNRIARWTATAPPMEICRVPVALSARCPVGTNPEPDSFEVWNCGGGLMDYTISVNADWLRCEPAQEQSMGEQDTITVHYDTSLLPAGAYEAVITITAPGAFNSPQSVAVSLEVAPYWWHALGSGTDDIVCALTVYHGELIAGGLFTTAGGVACNRVARWDGSTWRPLGTGINGLVSALTVYNGDLIAGGFMWLNFSGDHCVARWDGSQWRPLGSGFSGQGIFGPSVSCLTVYDGELIAGGFFTTAGGVRCNNIARWDGSQWRSLGSGMNAVVTALTVYNGELIAGGGFTTAGGVTCNNIARWDGSNWQPLGAGMNGTVYVLMAYDDALIAGGWFTTAGYSRCNNIAAGRPAGGACCLPNGTCATVSANACASWGGLWYGAGVLCRPDAVCPPSCRGDTNCDGEITVADIDCFVEALGGEENWTHAPCPWLNADCNGDGDVSFADIDAFVALMGTSCP